MKQLNEVARMQELAGIKSKRVLRENAAETQLQDGEQIFSDAGFNFEDGLLGGVGSGGGGYYDGISDKINGFSLDKFDENEFNQWYDNFTIDSFSQHNMGKDEYGEEYNINANSIPEGLYGLEGGAALVTHDDITLYAYPILVNDYGMIENPIFKLNNSKNAIPGLTKDEVKQKLMSNEYSII
jgi:hypothetical protein